MTARTGAAGAPTRNGPVFAEQFAGANGKPALPSDADSSAPTEPAALSIDYAAGALPDLLPSVLAALSVPGATDVLGLGAPTRRAAVLLVDGLGALQLQQHADIAPFLSSMVSRGWPLAAGFPATTATSLASFGTGLPPGVHGLLGYEVALPDGTGNLNALSWDDRIDPTVWQPLPTAFEQATAAGIPVTRVGPAAFAGTGLTTAAIRGGAFVGAESVGERITAVVTALAATDRALAYVYYGDLDATGHRQGVNSDAWRLQLEHVDRMAQQLAERLPADTALWITADHGMVDIPRDGFVDLASDPELAAGVHTLAGEARARYLHCVPGARDDVVATWAARLGTAAVVHSREDAIAAGWFGPQVVDRVLNRIGDVVVAVRTPIAIVNSSVEPPGLLRLIGMHGSLTPEELFVPLLEFRR